jgi:hypothetical protein
VGRPARTGARSRTSCARSRAAIRRATVTAPSVPDSSVHRAAQVRAWSVRPREAAAAAASSHPHDAAADH